MTSIYRDVNVSETAPAMTVPVMTAPVMTTPVMTTQEVSSAGEREEWPYREREWKQNSCYRNDYLIAVVAGGRMTMIPPLTHRGGFSYSHCLI